MANRYAIRSCTNPHVGLGGPTCYTDIGFLTVGSVYKFNNTNQDCYEVTAFLGAGISHPTDLNFNSYNILGTYTGTNACTLCTIPSSAVKYLFTKCSGSSGYMQQGPEWRIGFRSNGDLVMGDKITIDGGCYEVTQIFNNMNNGPGADYSNNPACSCNPTPPPPPPPSSTQGPGGPPPPGPPPPPPPSSTQGPGAPGQLPTAYRCVNGNCVAETYDPAQGTLVEQGLYATALICEQNCQQIDSVGSWYKCVLENCNNASDTILAYRTTFQAPGQIYRFNQNGTVWDCYRVITITEQSPLLQKIGVNLDGKTPYQTCAQCLPADGPVCCFVGDAEVEMSDGTYCPIHDVFVGDEVKTSSGHTAKVLGKLTPIIGDRGLLSINGGKRFATPDHIFKSIDGLWLTADIELSRKSFKAFDKILLDGGIIKQLAVGDYIITNAGPVLIESFEIDNSGVFDDTVVYDLTLDSDSDHTYFVESYAAHNCDPPPGPPPPPPPNPPGCDAVPEPYQGDILTSHWSGPPFYRQKSPSDYTWMIDECWRWKYCVCKTQPDANDPYTHDYVVCLCGETVDNEPNPCPLSGTLIRYECRNSTNTNSTVKLEKWGIYTNGSCGSYEQKIEDNSIYCGAKPTPGCPKSGTLVRTYCINLDKYAEYNNGNCGTYIEKIETNSKSCGYVDPAPPPPPPPPKLIEEPLTPARVYYPISITDTLKTVDVTSFALWSNDTPFLNTPATQSSIDSSSLNYILHVYDRSPDTLPTCSAELQYNIIYADYDGKGARDLGGADNKTLTKAMYTQYAHVLLPHGQQKFNFNGTDEDYVYIIDISRKRFKQSLDPGNWEMTFASTSFSLDVEKDSILADMFTSSYQGATLTLVDTLTKRDSKVKPVYLSSKSYDVVIGTIEDGIGTNYVTSSYTSISSSLAQPGDSPYINTGTSTGNSTAIVNGTRVYYWGLGSTVGYRLDDGSFVDLTPPASIKNSYPTTKLRDTAYTMSLSDIRQADNGQYIVTYEGYWTGSLTFTGGEIINPEIMSGSCLTQLLYDSDFQVSQSDSEKVILAGWAFPQPLQDYNDPAYKQTLTINSITYNGHLKWASPELTSEYFFSQSVAYNTPVISGSAEPDVFAKFYTDEWGMQDFVEDPTNPKDENSVLDGTYFDNYKDLDNGFILVPVRKTSFGRVYPNHGIIVLSGKKLDGLGLNTNRSIDKNGYNTYRLYHSMEMVLKENLTDLSGDALAFYARGVDIKRSARYFVTLKNSHLNFSNNPTYVTGSEGEIVDSFLRQNKSYFSSIGLYNDEKQLLAIGKISKPIMSSLTDEMLFTVKVAQ